MMNAIVLDTHAVVWAFLDPARLSTEAVAALEAANKQHDIVWVSAISLVEISYLIEKNRLPSETKVRLLLEVDNPNSNLRIMPLNRDVADRIEQISRDMVPDMPAVLLSSLHSPLVASRFSLLL
jgi:PIN domain nuclease of toxin-antitoxin system